MNLQQSGNVPVQNMRTTNDDISFSQRQSEEIGSIRKLAPPLIREQSEVDGFKPSQRGKIPDALKSLFLSEDFTFLC